MTGRALVLSACALVLTLPAPARAGAMPQPPHVQVFNEPCPDTSVPSAGCAFPDGRVYLAGADSFIRSHEVAYIFDFELMTEGDRAWFGRRLAAGTPWDGDTSEMFADLWANCDLLL